MKQREILIAYQKAINKIDDYFEYSMESKKDQEKVHKILDDLMKKLKELNEAP